MKRLIVSVLALLLVGCGAIRNAEFDRATEKANIAYQECKMRRAARLLHTMSDEVACANPRVIEAFREVRYPNMDLILLYAAASEVAAEKVDKGDVTEAQAKLELAELRMRLSNEERRRHYEAQHAQAEAAASNAELLVGLAALSAASQPRRPVTCLSTGPLTQCN